MKKLSTLLVGLLASTYSFSQDAVKIHFFTSHGEFKAEVYPDKMPITANNFIDLVEREFYDGSHFHRVIANFVIQSGDHNTNGKWAVPAIQDETHPELIHDKEGVLSMAKYDQPNTATSQFFVTLAPATHLDSYNFAAFGQVYEGMDVVHSLGSVPTKDKGTYDRPIETIKIDSARIITEDPTATIAASADQVKIFPNPATDILYMDFVPENVESIELINLQGQVVKKLDNLELGKRLSIDVSELSSGMYIARYYSDSQPFSKKISLR